MASDGRIGDEPHGCPRQAEIEHASPFGESPRQCQETEFRWAKGSYGDWHQKNGGQRGQSQ